MQHSQGSGRNETGGGAMFTPWGAMGAIGRKGATPPFLGETLYIIVYMLGALHRTS